MIDGPDVFAYVIRTSQASYIKKTFKFDVVGGVSKNTAIAHSTLNYNLRYKYCPNSIFFTFCLCTIINVYLYLFSILINMYL